MKKFIQQLLLLAGVFLACAQLQAQATLSVQGTIVQNTFTGGAAAIDNGQYDITFKLYTTDVGGTAIWSETQTIAVIGGVYSALLGAVNPLNVPFDQTYYLGLTLPGGPEHSPRTQLTSSPYALALLGQDNKFPSTGMVKMSAMATGTDITTATSYTVAANDHVIYLDHTANQNVTLPAATTANMGRNLMLVNKAAVAKTLTSSNYVDLAGATATTVPANSAIDLQSDGSVWRQTGGYVTPAVQAKAYVLVGPVGSVIPYNSGGFSTIPLNESQDPQNCFASNTFTAPRTGFYRVSGFLAGSYNIPSPSNGIILIRCGGTCAFGVAGNYISNYYWNSTANGEHNSQFSADVYMTAGQTLTLQAASNFTNGMYFHATSFRNYISILEQ